MKKKILAFGEIIWDVYPDAAVIGGAPLNFAAHAVRCGAECALVSAVGADDLGARARGELCRFGVGGQYVKTAAKPTGQCLVTLGAGGVPQYDVLRDVAYDSVVLSPEDFDAIRAERYDALYFGTLSSRAPLSRAALHALADRIAFPEIVCDVNLRKGCYDAESVRFCLSHATVLKLSAEEEPLVRQFGFYAPAGESPAQVLRAVCTAFPQIRTAILTLGPRGAFALERASGSVCYQPAVGNTVVSTVGAGDSFTAAFTAARLGGEPTPACLARAAQVSGFVVSRLEAVPEYGTDA